ncbi:flagella basal body P-ring formation protein FlgA [candidate division WOR-1 bacterium RIFOXYA12_FULL_43_27]|uniref:Flagella basal body P-ring formation protein FlgA n=1 Tax=candidate division WOR-1 bacterium RIFOXYC2_FULL_46_14 TaxID=1802587 RepID=A0A1F4U321_UNCSA|nr:MAG: flagella basal body P-ring formation protein FlgA [candidate division WOR-1 bacterium RIFOXYA12_FULL_43_27]OGC19107.1 MAG: flagella basal body P-ring formation protein FlgA [candidate division WOR-1 bacterium RIFOXYB2_FULL_46_45]OGC30095.1 MAG: flagella basal body P-ring formation protein FlgA [candidate division WOR-1 bacterium RIFOXYA2_FULL_46_56]OGC39336.1 MAG: flagella basal body P-ring formation protein FlgA [candidate division WOR-1 bacterium RIFOXYC2_FULL_46_14]
MRIIFLIICCLLIAVSPIAADDSLNARIEKAIKDYIVGKNPSWNKDKLMVVFALNGRTASQLASYGENVSITVPEIYPTSGITRSIILPVQVIDNGVEKEKIFIRTEVALKDKVVAAARSIKKDEVFDADSIALSEQNILSLSGKYFTSLSEVLGKQAKGYVSSGAVLAGYMVKSIPDVKKGEEVSILAQSDGIRVEAKGEALQEGTVGDKIKLRRTGSRDILNGKITATGEVEVQL